MLKKYIFMLCLAASLNTQGSAFQGFKGLGYRAAEGARYAYNYGRNQLGAIRSAAQGYKPTWMTSNIGAFKRPVSNMATFAQKSNWARPALMTGLAGAGLGTGYYLMRSPVFAQETNDYWKSLQYALPKKMQERIDELTHGLNTSCDGRDDYFCASAILNGFDELIGILLGDRNAKMSTGLKNEDINFRGDRKQLAQDQLPQLLVLRKQAAQKATENSRDIIQSDWQHGYSKKLLSEMLTDIGAYNGAIFKYGVYPNATHRVEIPEIYQDVITAAIKDNPYFKRAMLNDLANTKRIVAENYKDGITKQALLNIADAVEAHVHNIPV